MTGSKYWHTLSSMEHLKESKRLVQMFGGLLVHPSQMAGERQTSYRPRTSSSTRDLNVGLRNHSVASGEERSTLTNPSNLFQRSNSAASIETQYSRFYGFEEQNEQPTTHKIFIPTAPRRSSNAEFEQHATPRLVYNTSYGGKMEFAINKDENTIGRREGNDIVLGDERVSKDHAIIVKTAKG